MLPTTRCLKGVSRRAARILIWLSTVVGLLLLLLVPLRSQAQDTLVRTLPLGARGVVGQAAALGIDTQARRLLVTTSGDDLDAPSAGTVTTLDLTTGAILHTAGVGVAPDIVAVDSRSGRAFVLNRGADTDAPASVTMVASHSGAVLRTFRVGTNPVALVVDERTNRVFVADDQSKTVRVLNATTGSVEHVVTLRDAPEVLAVAPLAGHVIVAGRATGSYPYLEGPIHLTMLDARTGARLRTLPTALGSTDAEPGALAVDERRGRIFLAVIGDTAAIPSTDQVITFDATSGRIVGSASTGSLPLAIAVDHATARAFVLNWNSNSVTVVDEVSGRVMATVPVGIAPRDIAVDERAGRVLIANTNVGAGGSVLQVGSVSVLDARTGHSLGTSYVGPLASDLAVDRGTGQAFVLSSGLPDLQGHYRSGTIAVLSTHTTPAALLRQPPPPAPFPLTVGWLRVDARHPRTLYLGGTVACPTTSNNNENYGCSDWALRSTDGGATWTDLRLSLGIVSQDEGYSLAPAVIAADGRHIYIGMGIMGPSPASYSSGLIRSADGGQHWHNTGPRWSYGAGLSDFVVSPVSSRRVYAAYRALCFDDVARSNDGGVTWKDGHSPPTATGGCFPEGSLVADPTRADTVYINGVTESAPQHIRPLTVVRSDDAGLSWSTVTTPTASPPLQSFAISAATRVGALLVGRTVDPAVPADRRWLSADGGRTWTATTCPGDLGGICPAFVAEGVGAAGASYAFMHNSVYRFLHGGPATARLAISAALPVPTSHIRAIGTGLRAGDPIYLLAQQTHGNIHGTLYASTDGARSWHRLAEDILARLAPLPTPAR